MPRIRVRWTPPSTRGDRAADIGHAIALAKQAGMYVAEPRREGEPYSVRRAGAQVFTAGTVPEVVEFLRAELQATQEHAR